MSSSELIYLTLHSSLVPENIARLLEHKKQHIFTHISFYKKVSCQFLTFIVSLSKKYKLPSFYQTAWLCTKAPGPIFTHATHWEGVLTGRKLPDTGVDDVIISSNNCLISFFSPPLCWFFFCSVHFDPLLISFCEFSMNISFVVTMGITYNMLKSWQP